MLLGKDLVFLRSPARVAVKNDSTSSRVERLCTLIQQDCSDDLPLGTKGFVLVWLTPASQFPPLGVMLHGTSAGCFC